MTSPGYFSGVRGRHFPAPNSRLEGPGSYRRSFGLIALAYASLHALTFVGLDRFFGRDSLLEDVRKRRYVAAGPIAFVCMLPLAVVFAIRVWYRGLRPRARL